MKYFCDPEVFQPSLTFEAGGSCGEFRLLSLLSTSVSLSDWLAWVVRLGMSDKSAAVPLRDSFLAGTDEDIKVSFRVVSVKTKN